MSLLFVNVYIYMIIDIYIFFIKEKNKLTGIFNFHDDNGFEYSLRRSNDDGFGHLSCFVVVYNVEQNWEFEEINFKLY